MRCTKSPLSAECSLISSHCATDQSSAGPIRSEVLMVAMELTWAESQAASSARISLTRAAAKASLASCRWRTSLFRNPVDGQGPVLVECMLPAGVTSGASRHPHVSRSSPRGAISWAAAKCRSSRAHHADSIRALCCFMSVFIGAGRPGEWGKGLRWRRDSILKAVSESQIRSISTTLSSAQI